MDIFVNNLKGRDPEKDCSHRPKKIREVGGLDCPKIKHREGFTGKMKSRFVDGKLVCFEQIGKDGRTTWEPLL